MGFTSFGDVAASAAPRSGFAEWVEGVRVHTIVGKQHGQWYAVATDFSLSGMGPTMETACENLGALVECYMRSFYDEGTPLDQAIQPLGLLRKLRMLLPLKQKTRLVLHPIVH